MNNERYVLIQRGVVLASYGTFASPAEALEYAHFCLPMGVINQVFVADTQETKLAAPKTCNCCGRTHNVTPRNARVQATGSKFDGYYFECACLSTLFSPRAA